MFGFYMGMECVLLIWYLVNGTPSSIGSVLLMWVSHMCCSCIRFMWDDYKWVIFGTIMCAYDNLREKQDEDIRGYYLGLSCEAVILVIYMGILCGTVCLEGLGLLCGMLFGVPAIRGEYTGCVWLVTIWGYYVGLLCGVVISTFWF